VSPAIIEQHVPDNLQQLIEGQLRLASPEEREVLEVASVAGAAFDAPAVAAGLDGAADLVESICHRLSRGRRWLSHLGNREWPDGALAARYAFRHALYRRALYESLSPSRRATLHERIGRRLEAGYAGRTIEVSSELARHFEAGRDPRRLLIYLSQAAMRAYDRRAYRDVIACLAPALPLLDERADNLEDRREELRLRRLYAVVLSQTAGYAAEALLRNLERMQRLAEELGDAEALFDALSARLLLDGNSGHLLRAEQIGSRLSEVSEKLGASAALQCSVLRGSAAFWRGDLEASRSFLAAALASPAGLEEAERPYDVNPVVAARSFEGLRRWLTGQPAEAVEVQQEASALGDQHGHPFTRAHAAVFGAVLFLLEEDWAVAAKLAARAIDLADEHGFPRWRGSALVIRGRALAEDGDGARGFAEIRQGLDVLRRTGLRLGDSLHWALLAGACLRLGRLDEGLVAADAGLAHCRDTAERCFEAELWRLRGEILPGRADAARPPNGAVSPEAAECFERAAAVARAQGAVMLERRAARRAVARTPGRRT